MIGGDGTVALCVNSCYSSLVSARSTIAGACTGSDDFIVYNDVAYPGMMFNLSVKMHRLSVFRSRFAATFFADSYLFAYNMSCRTDRYISFCRPTQLESHSYIHVALPVNTAIRSFWRGRLKAILTRLKAAQIAGLAFKPCN